MTFPFNVDHLSVCIHGIKANDNKVADEVKASVTPVGENVVCI